MSTGDYATYLSADEDYGEIETETRRLPLISIIVAAFIFAATSRLPIPQWHNLVKAVGALLALAYFVRSLQARVRPTPEMILYGVFIGWSLTGLIGAAVPALFWQKWFTLVQVWILIILMTGFTVSRRALTLNLSFVVLACMVVAAGSIITGSYKSGVEEGARVTTIGVNANGFGRIMIVVTVCAMYFWMRPSRSSVAKFALLVPTMVVASMLCILSGSRTSVVGLALLYLLWTYLCYRKEALQRKGLLVLILLGLVVGGYGFVSFTRRSTVGKRFQATIDNLMGRREGGLADRDRLYGIGLRLFRENPIVGVGLLNFKYYTGGKSSHSDYLDILTATGLPGFLIYYSIYVAFWLRTRKIVKYCPDPDVVKTVRLFRAVTLVYLALGLGAPNYSGKLPWIILGSFVGYSNAVWESVRHRMAAAETAAGAAPAQQYAGT